MGLACNVTDSLTTAFDVEQIYYSSVNSVGNPLLPNLMTARLGDDQGAGFGWKDMTIYKLGAQWQQNKDWTWWAGVSYGAQQIPDSAVLFNIAAPGVNPLSPSQTVELEMYQLSFQIAFSRRF